MKVKDLNKFYIKVLDGNPEDDVSDIEYAQLIRDTYSNMLKHMAPQFKKDLLEKEFERVRETPIEFGIIKSIYILENAFLERREPLENINSFFMIETENKEFLIFNMSTGENHTLEANNSLGILLDTTFVHEFYKQESNEIKTNFSLNNNVEIMLHKNVLLENIYSKETIKVKNLIDIHDDKENKIYLDVDKRTLYVRNNYDINIAHNTKSFQLFKPRETITFDSKLFSKLNYNKYKISNEN